VNAGLRRWLALLPALLGLTLFALSIWSLFQELRHYRAEEIWQSLQAIHPQSQALAVGLTGLNYLVFTAYDSLALRYIRYPLPYRKAALAAITSTAISNSVGLSLLSNSAIRYRFYAAWGIPALDIAHLIAFCNLSFWLGLVAISGLVFSIQPPLLPSLIHLPVELVRLLGGISFCFVISYVIWTLISSRSIKVGSFAFPYLSTPLAIGQIFVAVLDWGIAATVLYVLLPLSSIPYSMFLSAYLLGQIAGLISNIPGGLGIFETTLLLLLQSSVSKPVLLSALLAYRAIYYLLPLGLAVLLFGFHELRHRRWLG